MANLLRHDDGCNVELKRHRTTQFPAARKQEVSCGIRGCQDITAHRWNMLRPVNDTGLKPVAPEHGQQGSGDDGKGAGNRE